MIIKHDIFLIVSPMQLFKLYNEYMRLLSLLFDAMNFADYMYFWVPVTEDTFGHL